MLIINPITTGASDSAAQKGSINLIIADTAKGIQDNTNPIGVAGAKVRLRLLQPKQQKSSDETGVDNFE